MDPTPALRVTFLTPSFRPYGGVVKVFDYVEHVRALGHEAVVWSPTRPDARAPLFGSGRFLDLLEDPGTTFTTDQRFSFGDRDLAFFSWPEHFQLLAPRVPPDRSWERLICIVQNVRHANPAFTHGYALRLLTRPMARIVINDVVLDAIRPYLNTRGLTRVIDLGHATDFFALDRTSSPARPLRVGYTTWKSTVGDAVAAALADDERFEFSSIREHVNWFTLRELYHSVDVFLSTPSEEEGFYLPGLEAMAAGCVVLTPDAGGNRAYCRFGENCIQVGFEDAPSYVDALVTLLDSDVEPLRAAGYRTAASHSLDAERAKVATLLADLFPRIEADESGRQRPWLAAAATG